MSKKRKIVSIIFIKETAYPPADISAERRPDQRNKNCTMEMKQQSGRENRARIEESERATRHQYKEYIYI